MKAPGNAPELATLVAGLVDRYYPALFAYLYYVLGDRHAADDVAQETFLRAYEARTALAALADSRAWLFRTATSLAVGLDGSQVPSTRWGPSRALDEGLVNLDRPQRALVLLHGHFGFTANQASAIVGREGRAPAARLAQAYEVLSEAYRRREPSTDPNALTVAARVAQDLVSLPEPWPVIASWRQLAAAIRNGDVAEFRRLPAPRTHPQRRPWLVVPVLVLLLASGAWLMVRRTARLDVPGTPAVARAGPATAAPPEATATPPSAGGPAAYLDATPDPAALDWLRKHAVRFTAAESQQDDHDLDRLDTMIAGVRVVAVDDPAGFGSHEAQAFRQRVLELLVQRQSFTVLVLQVDWAAGELIDRYVRGQGNDDPAPVLDQVRQSRGLAGGVWQSQEMGYTLRWLRAWNRGLPPAARVVVRGFLPITRAGRVPQDTIVEYLRDVDPGSLARIRTSPDELVAWLRDQRHRYEGRSSYMAYRHALGAAEAMLQSQRYDAAGSDAERARLYDSLALENLMEIADEAGAEGHGLIWTSNLAGSGLPSAADLLANARRQGVALALGFAFGQGSLYLTGRAGPLPQAKSLDLVNQYGITPQSRLAVYPMPQAAGATLEDYFQQAGQPRFYLDTRSVARGDSPAAWLALPQMARVFTGDYWDCFPLDYYGRVRVAATYDIMVYFRQVTPANLLFRPPTVPGAACPASPTVVDPARGVTGWTRQGDAREYVFGAGSVPEPTASVKNAAFITGRTTGQPLTWGVLAQDFRADAYRGQRIRVSAALLLQGNAAARGNLWLSITGLGRQVLVYNTRPVNPGAGWQRVEIVVDVPANAEKISLGGELRSQGNLWFADEHVETVSNAIPTTVPARLRPH